MNETEYHTRQQEQWDRIRQDKEHDEVMNRAVEAIDARNAREAELRSTIAQQIAAAVGRRRQRKKKPARRGR